MADKNTFIDSAQKYLQKGQLDKAIREYYRALELDPRDVRVRHKLGELLARQGTRGEAIKELGIVAEAYSKEGFYLKAVAVYKQMVKVKPDMYDVHLKLGGLYQQLSLLSDAMEHFRLVADYYEVNGTSKDCLEVFKKIVELSPDDTHSKLKLAEFYVREEKSDEAIALYQAVIADLKEKNRIDDLIRVYERLVQLAPSNLETQKTLARYYLEAQDAKRALTKLQVCFKADPGDTETLGLLGETFMALDQVPKAKSVYKELARIYEYQGFPERRREIFERIRRIDPGDADALKALGLNAQPEIEVQMAPAADPFVASSGAKAGGRGASTPEERPQSAPAAAPRAVTPPVVAPAMAAPAAPVSPVATPAGRPTFANAAPLAAQPASPPPFTAAVAVPVQAGSGSEKLREIPSSISKLMTEVEVYLKYNLAEKASNHLKLILEREPNSYLAREKSRELLASQGRNADAALESQKMSILAATVGDTAQARVDLERAIQLDPANPMYQHALASLSRIAPAAPVVAPPPFFQSSSSAHVLIEEEDEDELVDDEQLHSLYLGMDESELVDDGESGVPSVYLTITDDELSGDADELGFLNVVPSTGSSSPASAAAPSAAAPSAAAPSGAAPSAGASSGAASAAQPAGAPSKTPESAPPSVKPAVAAPAAATPAAAPSTPGRASGPLELESTVFDMSSAFEELDELVEDGDPMDLIHELEIELGVESGRKKLLEPVDRASSPLELAKAYFQMRLYDEALRQVELTRGQGPFGFEAQWLLGQVHFHRGDLAEAVHSYRIVLNRNDLTATQELEVLFDLGLAYMAQGEYQLALDLFEEVTSIDDNFREKEVQAKIMEISAMTSSGNGPKVQNAR